MLIDTSVLVRTLQPNHLLYEAADKAIRLLGEAGRDLHVAAQNLVELWAVATRPLSQNGLGMSIPEATAELERLQNIFRFLPDNAAIYPAWEGLVRRHDVKGRPTHDARLVAVAQVYGLSAILTFDRTGFSRFPDIEVIHPADVQG